MRGAPLGVTFGGPDPERRVGPVVAENVDARLEVFALGDDGAVWHLWQRAPFGEWNAHDQWASRGRPSGVVLLDFVVESNADGRLEIFALGDDGCIWQTHQ